MNDSGQPRFAARPRGLRDADPASGRVLPDPRATRLSSRRTLLGLLGASSILSACASLPPPGSIRSLPDGSPDASTGPWPDAASPAAGADPGPPGRVSEELAREVAFLALSLIDTPYRYGGNTPDSGFDCSGLIVYVFGSAAGVALPRTVAKLAWVGQPVRPAAMRTGDLVLFDTTGRFSHAGIYVGAGRFVHAPSSGGTVRLDGVRAPYWRPRFAGARRV